jgi:hypothetical protein
MPFYCGNNGNSPLLVANGGNRTLGTRHDCLRQGIGVGLNMPLDPSYLNPYNPINNTRYYCGNAAALPAGYDANGTLNMCHGIGIGVGRRKRALAAPLAGGAVPLAGGAVPLAGGAVPLAGGAVPLAGGAVPLAGGAVPLAGGAAPLAGGAAPLALYLICFVLMISIFVITMLYKKPSFIKKKDTEEIDWYVFSPYIALFSIVVGIILYMIYKSVS